MGYRSPIFQSIGYRKQRADIGGRSRPHSHAKRIPARVDHDTDNHLVQYTRKTCPRFRGSGWVIENIRTVFGIVPAKAKCPSCSGTGILRIPFTATPVFDPRQTPNPPGNPDPATPVP
ncbi:hypothetical protein JXA40_05695 [bacterium]|nr:hypothetical protein [candidate division CSSED10-310 bacterium]